MTAGKWPWKSATSKDRVTTHLPNLFVSKMDDAKPKNLCKTERDVLNHLIITLSCRKITFCKIWRF